MDSDDERQYEEIQQYDNYPESQQPYSSPETASQEEQENQGQVKKKTIPTEDHSGIKIAVTGRDVKGNALKKHTVYLIEGTDKNGPINVYRRFNQFHEMRVAMVKRWPGCFIPSIPSKNLIMKNDQELNRKRERYLSEFVKKIGRLPHLYLSEEFQALLRSTEKDLSSTFEQWPNPTTEEIIFRYRDNFSQLQGKEVSEATKLIIQAFSVNIEKNQEKLIQYRGVAKRLAIERDQLNKCYPDFFKSIFLNYETNVLAECIDTHSNKTQTFYLTAEDSQFGQHGKIVSSVTDKNAYWLLYDLIKHEERDGRAFVQLFKSIDHLDSQLKSVDTKMIDNSKGIVDIQSGKKNIKTLGMKGTNDQIKFKLEVENEALKKQKSSLLLLKDITLALIAYIEIEKYKHGKKYFYETVIRKLTGSQISFVEKSGQVWMEVYGEAQQIKKNLYE